MNFPDIPPGMGLPLTDMTTHRLPQPTMDIISADAASAVATTIGRKDRLGSFSLGVQMADETPQTIQGSRSWRVPFVVPIDVPRVRLRIANYDRKGWNPGPSSVGILALSVGRAATGALGALNGAFVPGSMRALAPDAGTIPSNGTYYTLWIDGPFKAGVPYLLAGATNWPTSVSNPMSPGWMWTGFNGNYPNAANAVIESAAPTNAFPSLSRFEFAFDYIVPTAQRSLLAVGDSLTQNYGAAPAAGYTRPYKALAWPEQYALRHRIAVANIAVHGTRLATWANAAHPLWNQVEMGGFDAAVNSLGSNDLRQPITGSTLADMQTNWLAVNANLRAKNGADTAIYAATIMPATTWGSNDVAVVNPIRLEFNQWLASLPDNILGIFDFATVVADPANYNLRAAQYASSDAVHFNNLGSSRLAQSVTLPLLTM